MGKPQHARRGNRKETACVLDEAQRAEAMGPLREEEARRGAALARVRIEQEKFEKEAAASPIASAS